MKHYCNRRTPQTEKEPPIPELPIINAETHPPEKECIHEEDEVVLPPGCDGSMFEELGKRVITYAETAKGGLVTQCKGFGNQNNCRYMMPQSIYADNLSGEFDTVSVQTPKQISVSPTMADYIKKYTGKYICLDLWTQDSRKGEKCGVLVATGQNFIVIQNDSYGELSVIDLESVKYISIYCR